MLRTIILGTAANLTLGTAAMADLSDLSWNEVVAQAQDEGEVVWFQWYFEDRFREVVKGFEDEYGITVVLPDLDNGDAGLNKVLAEAGRDAGDIDVVSIPGSRASAVEVNEFFVSSIMSMLPDAANLTDQAEGGDWEGAAVKFWGNQTGLAYYSARTELETLPQTFADLEGWMEENPGSLGFNFENGGSGPSLIHNISRNILGITADNTVSETPDLAPVFDWFTSREDQYILTTGNNDSYARLNDGEFTMVAVWEDGIGGLIASGEINENIKVYLPEFGMNGSGNVVAIPENASNPAAALLFVSWLTSAETQTQLNLTFGSASANANSDDSFALIPNAQRANSTNWGELLKSDDVVPAVIENVFQN
ncbi:MAG: extracellular solute-binding protein [Paracoccaceae bacterium]